MEYNNKNENQKNFDKYLFNQRKINHMTNQPYKEKKIIFDSFKTTNNKLEIPLIKRNGKNNKSYNKNNNMVVFNLPEYELINLKREKPAHIFTDKYKYINENKRRLLNMYHLTDENNSSVKYRNSNYFNFPQNTINSDNYYLKTEYNNYYNKLDNANENKDNKENNINNNINTNKLSSLNNKEKKIKRKENEIILPLNLDYKQKNYMKLDNTGNFMEKYEYYLLNLNKKPFQNNKKINMINNSEGNKKYYNTSINFFNNSNYSINNNLQQIKPYKYKEYNLNFENNKIQNNNLTDRNNTLQNYNDILTNKLINKDKKSKTINSNRKVNIHINNHFEHIIDTLQRKLLCINEKNEDIEKRIAVSLLGEESEKLNNDVDKIMNIICKIKNFSFKEDSKILIPLINEIILDKTKHKDKNGQSYDKNINLNDKNNNKFNLLNKELKVFDLDKNFKYGYNEEEEPHLGMFYSLVKQRNVKRNRFKKRNKIRYLSHLNYKTQLVLKNHKKIKRYKSYDNIKNNNNDDNSFYIPSIYSNRQKKEKKPINNYIRNKSNYTRKKPNSGLNLKDNNFKPYSSSLFNKQIKNNRNNLQINNIKTESKTYKKNNGKKNEENELKVFLNDYKSKTIKNDNKELDNNNKSNESNENSEKNERNEKKENNPNEDNNKKKLKVKISNTINKQKIKKIIYKKETNSLKNHNNNIKTDKSHKSIFKENIKSSYKVSNKKSKHFKPKFNPKYSVNIYNPNIIKSSINENNDLSPIKDKEKKFDRRKSTMIKFKKLNSKIYTPSKPVKKHQYNTVIKNDYINNNMARKRQSIDNYVKFFNFLKNEEDNSKNQELNVSHYNSHQKTRKKTLRFLRSDKNENNFKNKDYLKQKTFKDFKEESYDEELGDFKNICKEQPKIKKKSNLSKFKNVINKMRDMPIEEYMNYIENFYGNMDKNQNNSYNVGDQVRINKFLDTMRKNIEKFKGRQNILTINCQPIDYIITVGNGLGSHINKARNYYTLKNDFSKDELSN